MHYALILIWFCTEDITISKNTYNAQTKTSRNSFSGQVYIISRLSSVESIMYVNNCQIYPFSLTDQRTKLLINVNSCEVWRYLRVLGAKFAPCAEG